jgi:hypothetical protein
MFAKLKSRVFSDQNQQRAGCAERSGLRFQCPAGSDWHIRLPRSGRTEVTVTLGELLISANGNTTRMTSGRHVALSNEQQLFVYNTSEREAEITLSHTPAGKIWIQKIPAG